MMYDGFCRPLPDTFQSSCAWTVIAAKRSSNIEQIFFINLLD